LDVGALGLPFGRAGRRGLLTTSDDCRPLSFLLSSSCLTLYPQGLLRRRRLTAFPVAFSLGGRLLHLREESSPPSHP